MWILLLVHVVLTTPSAIHTTISVAVSVDLIVVVVVVKELPSPSPIPSYKGEVKEVETGIFQTGADLYPHSPRSFVRRRRHPARDGAMEWNGPEGRQAGTGRDRYV